MYIRKRGASRRRHFDMLAELEKHVVKITGKRHHTKTGKEIRPRSSEKSLPSDPYGRDRNGGSTVGAELAAINIFLLHESRQQRVAAEKLASWHRLVAGDCVLL
ncbi:hypothetical protein OUZ56_027266 [Daphnia magna]|uniref:Uncharacterized protein n=1 Tax=Daphnia magna TaxID=35525 RepID=A0ABQ9ZPA7_9CRUS|nr:hypothetical protein OUZ56_027266 [Daphnia magna]